MPATRSGPRSHTKRAPKKERLDPFTRLLIALGICGAILLAVGMVLLMSAVSSGGSRPPPDPDAASPVIAPDHPRQLVDFSLLDQTGHTVTRADLQGKIVLVSFLFTSCSITCPYVNAQMQGIQNATASDPRVRLLSITLDPTDDTVYVLSKYAAAFGAKPDRWSFLTGDIATIQNLIGTSFLAKDTTGEFSYMPGNFANTQRIVLVDGAGKVVSYFDGLNQNAATAALAQIHHLEGRP